MQPIVDFILELDKLKGVTRKVKPIGLDRYENSAEHSWQLTMLATALAHEAVERVDISRVVSMLLVHDVGEIDAGDTMVFTEGGWDQQKAKELAGARRVFGLLPDAQRDRLLSLWLEFEAGETAEARFAHAIDRAMPVLLNLHSEGQSWRENGISYDRVVTRVGPPIKDGCPALWAYLEPRLKAEHERGWFGISG